MYSWFWRILVLKRASFCSCALCLPFSFLFFGLRVVLGGEKTKSSNVTYTKEITGGLPNVLAAVLPMLNFVFFS